MEKGKDDVLKQKPRKRDDSILNAKTMIKIGYEGLIIFSGVMAAYFIGLQTSDLMASTMAFSTLCLSRLLHGFSSRGNAPFWKLGKNESSIYAFLTGAVLLVLILFIPNMHGLFSIGPITLTQFFIVVGLSLATFVIVQITKVIQYRG